MTSRAAGLSLAAIVIVIAVIGATAMWLLHTASGASWLWSRLEAALPDRLSAASVEGTVAGGLTLRSLRYDDPSLSVAAGQVALAIDVDLFPTRVVINKLEAGNVRIEPREAAADDGPAAPPDELLGMLRLPLPVELRQASLRHVTLIADGRKREIVTSLDVEGRWFESIEIGSLSLAAPAGQLDLQGGLALTAPFDVDAGTQLAASFTGTDDVPQAQAAAVLSGSLGDLRLELTSDSHPVTVSGSLALLGEVPVFDLVATAERLALPLRGTDPAVTFERLQLRAAGRISAWQADLETAVVSTQTGRVQANARAHGDLAALQLDTLTLSSPELAATLTGSLAWADSLVVGGTVDIERLDPARWLPGWPSPSVASGEIVATYSGTRLELERLVLAHSGGPARIDGSGIVGLERGVVDADLGWTDLQWPLPPDAATVDSASGQLRLEGKPEDWTAAGDIAIGAPGLPPGRFRLSGAGDLDGLQVEIADSEVLGGRLTGQAGLRWRGPGNWFARLSARDVNTGPLAPQWPGTVSTTFAADGQREPFTFDVDIEELTGRLRGRPVSASGRVSASGEDIRVRNLQVESGRSRIELDGDARSQDGLSFDASIVSLGDLVPAADGSLAAHGKLRTGTALPLLQIDLTAADLAWQDVEVDTLAVRNAASRDVPLALSMDLNGIDIAGRAFDALSVAVQGDPGAHRIDLQADAAGTTASLGLEGGVDSLDDLAAARWDGRLTAVDIDSGDAVTMRLRQPAAVHVSRATTELQRSCIDAEDGAALCASGSLAGSGAFAAVAEFESVPVDLVRLAMDNDLQFSQLLTGTVQVARQPRGKLSAGGRIDISPGQVRNTADARLTLRTRQGFARFALNDGSLLSGELSLPFSDTAEIAGSFLVTDIGLGTESPVEGRVDANVADIGVGANLLPMIDDAAGRLQADIRIDGTLAAPQFSGTANLSDGLIAYDPLGARVDDIDVSAEILEGNRVEIRSRFRAGDGRGEITTSADYLQGRRAGLELTVVGDNLTLIDVPDLLVKADSDLRIGVQDNDVTIDGRVVLPEARLSSVNLTSNSVSESADVGFVDEPTPDAGGAVDDELPFTFHGKVDLELGDKVSIDVDVAQARLRGSSTFAWNGPAMPRANGQYAISGKFEAYGQLLEITEGRIRYPNVPADRPELRIRAERDIFGNSQVRKAGVLVTGTALRPTLEVYTTPATSEDRALTLLATGSDFDYEQGVGAVDVGTYIAPRLYASYGIGLFDKENVISVRYDLASGFGIKATSGKRAAGIDISYTIEH